MCHSIQRAAAVALVALSAHGAAVSAYMINDGYSGGDAHGYGDRIGGPIFAVQGADVYRNGTNLTVDVFTAVLLITTVWADNRNGTNLTVDVFTSFAGHADEKLFASYTNKAPSRLNGISMGIGYGDLFLSVGWSPFGAAPYLQDNNVTGTQWTYGFSIDGDRWTDAGGTGTLFALTGATNNANTLLSEDFMSGAIYRNGQEIAVDRAAAGLQVVGTGTWSVTNNSKVSFSFDVGNTLLAGAGTVGLHWAMSSGNDTLEGAYQFPTLPPPPDIGVPEPTSLMLSLLGLTAIAGRRYARRKRRTQ